MRGKPAGPRCISPRGWLTRGPCTTRCGGQWRNRRSARKSMPWHLPLRRRQPTLRCYGGPFPEPPLSPRASGRREAAPPGTVPRRPAAHSSPGCPGSGAPARAPGKPRRRASGRGARNGRPRSSFPAVSGDGPAHYPGGSQTTHSASPSPTAFTAHTANTYPPSSLRPLILTERAFGPRSLGAHAPLGLVT